MRAREHPGGRRFGRALKCPGERYCPAWRTLGKNWDVEDFLKAKPPIAPNIVMNPPFGRAVLAEKFIRHAISLHPAKLAVFVNSGFVFGKARGAGLFAEFPPARIWAITPRPSCPPGEYLRAGNKAGGGRPDFCWIVWERDAGRAGPQLVEVRTMTQRQHPRGAGMSEHSPAVRACLDRHAARMKMTPTERAAMDAKIDRELQEQEQAFAARFAWREAFAAHLAYLDRIIADIRALDTAASEQRIRRAHRLLRGGRRDAR
jgi:hypothetical protein